MSSIGTGIISGVSGLIVRPAGGIVDAIGSITEGVSNNLSMWDSKPNSARIRAPRVFYGID